MVSRYSKHDLDKRIHSIISRVLPDEQVESCGLGSDILLTDILLEQRKLSEKQAAAVLEETMGVRFIDPRLISFSRQFMVHVSEFFSKAFLAEHSILPIKHEGLDFHIIMANPQNQDMVEYLEVITGSNIIRYVSTTSNIQEVIDNSYPGQPDYDIESWGSVLDKALQVSYTFSHHADTELSEILNQSSIIHLLRLILAQVNDSGISDIHFEPQEEHLRIRLRQDGVLRVAWELPSVLKTGLINRIKLLSGLKLGDYLKPQDGRISLHLIAGRKVDMRVSTLPALFGEKIVIRLLDKGKNRMTLEEMQLDRTSVERIESAMALPNGMILLTGPTGSGKTTTLYAILEALNHPGVNISTAEDPVEYELPGITQADCSREDGVTFSEALKSFMRQDPDIIMVGEVRDLETADIASKAALTGHLLLSTLHTNDAPSAITRLINIGVAPYILAACNIIVVAQRLLRRICNSCSQPTTVTEQEMSALNLVAESVSQEAVIYRGKGCEVCNHTGYKGRTAITEVLVLNDQIEKAIINGCSVSEISRIARETGMVTLRQSALNRMWQGIVTPEEVLRVTAESD